MAQRRSGSTSNLENEPNEPQNSDENSFGTALKGGDGPAEHHRLGEDQTEREVNEANVALIDTACTSCIHSKKWRAAGGLLTRTTTRQCL